MSVPRLVEVIRQGKILRERVERRIARKPETFPPRECADLGGADQMLGALRGPTRDGRLAGRVVDLATSGRNRNGRF